MGKDEQLLAELSWLRSGGPQDPRCEEFRAIINATGGMATPNKLALLNAAAETLQPGEAFLEVGTYKGTSIIGASKGHLGATFYTIDNFSQFSGPRTVCLDNLAAHAGPNVHLIEGNAWEVLAAPPWDEPIGVYFYDGRHQFPDQWNAFERIESLLAADALIIIDDTRLAPVRAANRAYTFGRHEYKRLLSFRSRYNGEPLWWNGVEVYHFARAADHGKPAKTHTHTHRRAWLNAILRLTFGRPYKVWLSTEPRIRRIARTIVRRLQGKAKQRG